MGWSGRNAKDQSKVNQLCQNITLDYDNILKTKNAKNFVLKCQILIHVDL